MEKYIPGSHENSSENESERVRIAKGTMKTVTTVKIGANKLRLVWRKLVIEQIIS